MHMQKANQLFESNKKTTPTLRTLLALYALPKSRLAEVFALLILAGIASTAMLIIINKIMVAQGPRIIQSAVFAAALSIFLLSQRTAQRIIISATEQALRHIRATLIEKTLTTEYVILANIGEERILTTLTTDATAVSRAGAMLVTLAVSLFTIVACLAYLAYLSLIGFSIVAVFIGVGVWLYLMLSHEAYFHFNSSRRTEDIFLKHVRDLILGVKELKLNRQRRTQFFHEDVQRTCAIAEEDNRRAKGSFLNAELTGNGMFFFLMGAVAVLFEAGFNIRGDVNRQFLIILIFLLGPLTAVVTNIPFLNVVAISANRIQELSAFLSRHREQSCGFNGKDVGKFSRTWREIRFQDIQYAYGGDNDRFAFHLGPLDLIIRAGEALFIIGGNGSGKTTLGKIIAGLYAPQCGMIHVDGTLVDESNRDHYRQLFSAVFSDYHIFSQLYGIDQEKLRSGGILDRLRIAKKVSVVDGQLSTTTSLSHGERKRLALATCCYEGRSIYFFDEWASDQDPIFKELFYAEIVPSLKQTGTTIIVITHDDRFFHLADRVLKLEEGQLMPWTAVDDCRGAGWVS